jgi:hypothetical protein
MGRIWEKGRVEVQRLWGESKAEAEKRISMAEKSSC